MRRALHYTWSSRPLLSPLFSFSHRLYTTGQTIRCKAAVAWSSNAPLTVEPIEVSPPAAGEVRIKLIASGVCHTDAYTLSGRDPEARFPVILGHEGTGVVESIGEGVTSIKPGDHVIALYTPECGSCKFCLSGKTNLCGAIRDTQGQGLMPNKTSRFKSHGKPLFHYMGCSTFSEYTVLPEIAVAKISKMAPLHKMALLGCCVTTGIGAVTHTCQVKPGSTVAVFGLGGVGLSVIQGARLSGASRIIGLDVNSRKFALARQLGATDCINPAEMKEDIVQHIVGITNGGVDYSFEAIGDTKVMRQALECTHKGWGTSCIIGVAGAGEEISTRPFMLVTGRTWKGTAFGGVRGRSEIDEFVNMYMEGDIDVDSMITHQFKLQDINKALELMKSGESIKSLILYD